MRRFRVEFPLLFPEMKITDQNPFLETRSISMRAQSFEGMSNLTTLERSVPVQGDRLLDLSRQASSTPLSSFDIASSDSGFALYRRQRSLKRFFANRGGCFFFVDAPRERQVSTQFREEHSRANVRPDFLPTPPFLSDLSCLLNRTCHEPTQVILQTSIRAGSLSFSRFGVACAGF